MQCRYCQTWNEADERRCARCGRRLQLAAPRPAPENYPLSTATAPALECLPGGQPLAQVPPPDVNYQPSLFRDAAGSPKVIPIPTLTPNRSHTAGSHASGSHATGPRLGAHLGQSSVERRSPQRTTGSRGAIRGRSDAQQSLDFYADAPKPDTAGIPMDAVIYCDAPVALPVHRVMAAAFDASMVIIGLGVFLAIFFLSGGQIVLNRENIPLFLGVALVLALFYRFLWCLADGDSPGMRFAGLRLVNFDGYRPDREQRMLRQIANLLSVGSAGLGLVWALVDEESLAWHDHISKTFPTPG